MQPGVPQGMAPGADIRQGGQGRNVVSWKCLMSCRSTPHKQDHHLELISRIGQAIIFCVLSFVFNDFSFLIIPKWLISDS